MFLNPMKFFLHGRIFFFLSIVVFLISCGEKTVPENVDTGLTGKSVTVSPDRTSLLRNPFSGWMIYSGMGSNIDQGGSTEEQRFWQRYDNFPSSEGVVNVPRDYAPILLMRVIWSQANPAPGVYVWQEDCNTPEAKRFKMLVNGAKERNMRLAFNFTADSQDKHDPACPEYLRERGCKYFETRTGSATVWTPYPDDPVFQQCYAEFIHDFAQEFNDPDRIAFIGGFGVGKWGEYHACRYSTGDDSPREQVFDFLVDTFVKEFTKIPITINAHRWIGTGVQWRDDFDPDSERLIQGAIAKGFSLQSAAFGMHRYFSTWEKAMLYKNRYSVPIASEGGWVKASHPEALATDGYKDWGDVRRGEFLDAQESCVNTLDLRYNENIEASEAYVWFNEAYEYVEKFIQEGCYRIYPDKLTLPETIRNGEDFKISHRWINLGWSYCPTNIKQWEGRYHTTFALLDKRTYKTVAFVYDDNARPSDWIKGKPSNYTLTARFEDVPPGDYFWAVGITDSWNDNKPGIYIAAKQNVTSSGWLKLFSVKVG